MRFQILKLSTLFNTQNHNAYVVHYTIWYQTLKNGWPKRHSN